MVKPICQTELFAVAVKPICQAELFAVVVKPICQAELFRIIFDVFEAELRRIYSVPIICCYFLKQLLYF